MTVLSLAELEYVGDERGVDGLQKIAVRLREIALRAGAEGQNEVEKLALEVAQELEAYQCEDCSYYKDECEEAQGKVYDTEKEVESLQAQVYKLEDANAVLQDNVTELMEQIKELSKSLADNM